MTTLHALMTVRPDAKGRITLGALAKGISGFVVSYDKAHRIVLEPLVEIPAREQWLFKNKTALAQVRRGLKQSADGHTTTRGSFAKYKDDDIE
jgi:hypothetical protein